MPVLVYNPIVPDYPEFTNSASLTMWGKYLGDKTLTWEGAVALQKIILKELKEEDARQLDVRLVRCAEKAFQEALKDKLDFNNYAEISDDVVKTLVQCYHRSQFFYGKDGHLTHVQGRLKEELEQALGTRETDRLQLMLPILGYGLIVSNEVSIEAVRKRSRKDKQGPNSKKAGDYPYNVWGRNNLYSVSLEGEIPFPDKFIEPKKRLENSIIASGEDRYDNNLLIFELRELLNKYKGVIRVQNLAQISLFLRDVLISFLEKGEPMDILIRLYLANYLNMSTFRSFALCVDNEYFRISAARKINNSKFLLGLYCETCGDDDSEKGFKENFEEQGDNDGSSSDESESRNCPQQQASDTSEKKVTFKGEYTDLIQEFCIEKDEILALINTFFDKDKLLKYSKCSGRAELAT